MTLDKAIEVLYQELDGRLINYPHELREAQRLGIEALKYIKGIRQYDGDYGSLRLPGETED